MFRPTRTILTILAAALAVAAASSGSDATLQVQKSASASPSVKAKPMIARIWHGRTLTAKADEYERYLNASGVERILKTDGNHGVEVLRKSDGPRTDFVVISYWESIDSVKRFAGPSYEKAVVLERDREFLIEVEPDVVHYEVVRAAGEKSPKR
jgi:heme-degrading monooxygenase HmoA